MRGRESTRCSGGNNRVQDLNGVLDWHVSKHRCQLRWLKSLHRRRGISELKRSRLPLCERKLVPVDNLAGDQARNALQAKATQNSGGTNFDTHNETVAAGAFDKHLAHARYPFASEINDLTIEHIAVQPKSALGPIGCCFAQRIRGAQHQVAVAERRR